MSISPAMDSLLRRRIVVIALVAWLPLLILSLIQGVAVGSAVAVPFLFDVDFHVRFLIALPLLIAAELIGRLFSDRGYSVKCVSRARSRSAR